MFGFALDSFQEGSNTWTEFKVFDAGGNLIASDKKFGLFTFPNFPSQSSYPEGQIDLTFAGVASYALFDFSSDFGRYIIDNFEGTYGSTEVPVPEPTTMVLLASGLIGLLTFRGKFKR